MKKRNMVFLLCMVGFVLLFGSAIHADVGNSFSGGNSSGGGYSGGYSGGYGGFGGFLFLGGSPFSSLFLILIIAFIVYSRMKSTNGTTTHHQSYHGGITSRVCDEASALAALKEVDPDFIEEDFKAYVGEVYITLQEAWESKKWDKVRPFESNALFNTHQRQIQEYITQNKTNHLDMQNIRNITIAQFKQNDRQEVLSVKLVSSLLDYVSDDETGKIIEGSKTQYQHRTYYLEFVRSAGVKTKVQQDLKTTNCPNCGAPTKVTSSGECEYCHSIITNGDYGWVLNEYSAW